MTYSQLLRIVEDHPRWERIALVFTMMVVIITGKNLKPLADAIDTEECFVVWQYDKRWSKPKDSSAPFVEKIQFIVQRAAKTKARKEAEMTPEPMDGWEAEME